MTRLLTVLVPVVLLGTSLLKVARREMGPGLGASRRRTWLASLRGVSRGGGEIQAGLFVDLGTWGMLVFLAASSDPNPGYGSAS